MSDRSSFEKAKAHLENCQLGDRVMEFPVSSATVKEAALALGCSEAEIAKTLSFLLPDGAILIVAAGDRRIDNAKYKATFGCKAKMIPPSEVEALVGYAPGGVCPFGVEVRVYLDCSLREFETVYPACGSDNSAVRLTVPELERACGCRDWVDVCKTPDAAV